LTIVSVGRAHLARARLPTLARLASSAVVSRRHFCVCPTTNNAHAAIYFGAYRPVGVSAVARLQDAGLHTIYVSPIRTSLYGLRSLLHRAGFHDVVDAERLRPRSGRAELDDWVLADQGVEAIAAAARGGRFFAHVHTTLTHVPYRVAESAFRRRPGEGDLGRFLDGLEEADAVLAALLDGLDSLGLLRDTLVIVSGDHGQSFGELGYWSHASAITAEQVDVPLVLAHPRLGAAEIDSSTHFDLLPTAYDLLGLHAPAGLGASIFLGRPAELFLWAGQPSRGSTSCFGIVREKRKWMVDVVLDRCLQMTWEDADPVELAGSERRYWQALCSSALLARGLR
jgi:membrane-anchored protein YejM (alkaline phosphatase superfamily)